MARALKMANHSIESLKGRCKFLGEQVVEQQQIITELQPNCKVGDMFSYDEDKDSEEEPVEKSKAKANNRRRK